MTLWLGDPQGKSPPLKFYNFIVKNSFGTLKSPKFKTSQVIFILKTIPHTVLKILSAQMSRKNFSKAIFFQGLGAFFTNAKQSIWPIFCTRS